MPIPDIRSLERQKSFQRQNENEVSGHFLQLCFELTRIEIIPGCVEGHFHLSVLSNCSSQESQT